MKKIKKAQGGDTLSPYMQKRAAQQAVKEKNIRARDSVLNRNAAAKGMTRAEVQKQQVKDKNKPNAPIEGVNTLKGSREADFKCTAGKQCGIAKEANKQNKAQKFKTGGKLTSKKK